MAVWSPGTERESREVRLWTIRLKHALTVRYNYGREMALASW